MSGQDQDPDWFGSLDPDPDTHWSKNLDTATTSATTADPQHPPGADIEIATARKS